MTSRYQKVIALGACLSAAILFGGSFPAPTQANTRPVQESKEEKVIPPEAQEFIDDENTRAPAEFPDWVAGFYLDEDGVLSARHYSDAEPGEVRSMSGQKIQVLPSEYSRADIEFLEAGTAELAKHESNRGFWAEYQGAGDIFVINGSVDAAAAEAILGAARYELQKGEAYQRFSRQNDPSPHRGGA